MKFGIYLEGGHFDRNSDDIDDAIEERVVTIIAGQRRLPQGWGLLTTNNPAGFQLMVNSFFENEKF